MVTAASASSAVMQTTVATPLKATKSLRKSSRREVSLTLPAPSHESIASQSSMFTRTASIVEAYCKRAARYVSSTMTCWSSARSSSSESDGVAMRKPYRERHKGQTLRCPTVREVPISLSHRQDDGSDLRAERHLGNGDRSSCRWFRIREADGIGLVLEVDVSSDEDDDSGRVDALPARRGGCV